MRRLLIVALLFISCFEGAKGTTVTLGPEGGEIKDSATGATFRVPAGALASAVKVTVKPSTLESALPEGMLAAGKAVVRIEAPGATLAKPGTLSVAIPAPTTLDAATLFRYDGRRAAAILARASDDGKALAVDVHALPATFVATTRAGAAHGRIIVKNEGTAQARVCPFIATLVDPDLDWPPAGAVEIAPQAESSVRLPPGTYRLCAEASGTTTASFAVTDDVRAVANAEAGVTLREGERRDGPCGACPSASAPRAGPTATDRALRLAGLAFQPIAVAPGQAVQVAADLLADPSGQGVASARLDLLDSTAPHLAPVAKAVSNLQLVQDGTRVVAALDTTGLPSASYIVSLWVENAATQRSNTTRGILAVSASAATGSGTAVFGGSPISMGARDLFPGSAAIAVRLSPLVTTLGSASYPIIDISIPALVPGVYTAQNGVTTTVYLDSFRAYAAGSAAFGSTARVSLLSAGGIGQHVSGQYSARAVSASGETITVSGSFNLRND